MISRTVEYALRAVVWLAYRPATPHTTREVAEAAQIPPSYLSKVLQILVDSGLILSRRGLGGGFVLAREPSKMTVLDVVNAVEPIARIRACPLGLAAHATRLCALHKRLDDALALVESAFASATIAELSTDPAAELPLGGVPSAPVPWYARVGNLAAPPAAAAAPTTLQKPKGRKPRR
jgi:Rrf2 family transcriptional regulator, nitric oxide-sensitive transcriptional repressor